MAAQQITQNDSAPHGTAKTLQRLLVIVLDQADHGDNTGRRPADQAEKSNTKKLRTTRKVIHFMNTILDERLK